MVKKSKGDRYFEIFMSYTGLDWIVNDKKEKTFLVDIISYFRSF